MQEGPVGMRAFAFEIDLKIAAQLPGSCTNPITDEHV